MKLDPLVPPPEEAPPEEDDAPEEPDEPCPWAAPATASESKTDAIMTARMEGYSWIT
jgi:hypothetical protein